MYINFKFLQISNDTFAIIILYLSEFKKKKSHSAYLLNKKSTK